MVLESQCHSHYPAVRTVIFKIKTSSTVKVNNIPEAMLFLLLANSFCHAETTFFFWILNIKSNHWKKILLLILLLPVAKHGSTEGITKRVNNDCTYPFNSFESKSTKGQMFLLSLFFHSESLFCSLFKFKCLLQGPLPLTHLNIHFQSCL